MDTAPTDRRAAPDGGRVVALATMGELPGGGEDAVGIVAALAETGIEARIVAWDDPEVVWDGFDAVATAWTWDYVERIEEFRAWIRRIRSSTRPLNDRLLEWNLDKRYLLDLAERGIDIPPTRVLSVARDDDLRRSLGDGAVVMKPLVGAGGRGARRFEDIEALLEWTRAVDDGAGALVQRFEERILDHGEISAVVIGGRLSHAVRKRPAAGEFRIQPRFGGSMSGTTLLPSERAFVERVLSALEGDVEYARVDFVSDGRRQALMEVELVEPDLFLGVAPDSFAAYAGLFLTDRRG